MSGHIDRDINEGRRLRHLPMETRPISRGWHASHVDDEVANGAKAAIGLHLKGGKHLKPICSQIILVCVPLRPISAFDVGVCVCTSVSTSEAIASWRGSPMTAMPLKVGEARRVGGFLASPISCV